jgi:acetylornithine/succinyldiaminopimelate/putrescine aminotransferase
LEIMTPFKQDLILEIIKLKWELQNSFNEKYYIYLKNLFFKVSIIFLILEMPTKIHPWADNVRYARTGVESMPIAIGLARAYTKKRKNFTLLQIKFSYRRVYRPKFRTKNLKK